MEGHFAAIKDRSEEWEARDWQLNDEERKEAIKTVQLINLFDSLSNHNHTLLTSLLRFQSESVSDFLKETWNNYKELPDIKAVRQYAPIEEKYKVINKFKKIKEIDQEIYKILQSSKSENTEVEMGDTTSPEKQMQKILVNLNKQKEDLLEKQIKAQEKSSKTSTGRKELLESTSSSEGFPGEKVANYAVDQLMKIVNPPKEIANPTTEIAEKKGNPLGDGDDEISSRNKVDAKGELIASPQEGKKGTGIDINELKAKIIDKVQRQKQEIKDLTEENNNKNKIITNLEKEINRVKDIAGKQTKNEQELRKTIKEQGSVVTNQKQEIDRLTSQVDKKAKSVKNLESQLKDANDRNRIQKTKIANLEIEKDKLEKDNQILNDRISDIKKQQEDKLENQGQEVKSEKQKLEAEKKKYEDELKAAREAEKKQHEAELRAEYEAEKQQEEKLENKDNKKNKKIEELEKKLEDLRQSNDRLLNRNVELVEAYQSVIEQLNRLTMEYNRLLAAYYPYSYNPALGHPGYDRQGYPGNPEYPAASFNEGDQSLQRQETGEGGEERNP